ncbi:MAG: glycoside hydrolase family 9 protein [Lentisphaeria bacterium]|nr:glycoside hydrolase family 9 protein [Lentisphaeria bacterium]
MFEHVRTVVFSGILPSVLTLLPTVASALDADPALIDAPDKKPFTMTVFGLRKAFPIASDTIRVEVGPATASGTMRELDSYRISSVDDPDFAYESFIMPVDVTVTEAGNVEEAVAPEGFKAEAGAANVSKFSRHTADLKLHAPMKPGCTYAVIALGHGSDMVSAGRAGYEFKYDPADLAKVPDMKHPPELRTLTVLGLRGLDSVGDGIIRLEFGPTFSPPAGFLLKNYHVTINGAKADIKAMGRRSIIDLYIPMGWPFSVLLQHEVFLRLDRPLKEGDVLRVEVDPSVVSGANAATVRFSDKRSYSNSIKVNQVGYIASSVKTAAIGRWMGSFPDEKAVLAVEGDEQQFRDITTDEIFFGPSRASTKENDADKKTDDSAKDASSRPDKDALQTSGVADHEFAKGALQYDTPPAFEIRDAATDDVVFSGKASLKAPGNRSGSKYQLFGENVYQIDFSDFKTPGRYYIAVPGTGRSFEFSIAPDVYDEAFKTSAYGIFVQRCGIKLEPPYSEWRRVACHDKGIQLSAQDKVADSGFIEKDKGIVLPNDSPYLNSRPPILSDPALIAHFPFNGSGNNAIAGGMTLAPAQGQAQSFKTVPNLIWDGTKNGVYTPTANGPNGWSGKLDYVPADGLTLSFWMLRSDAPQGNRYGGTLFALSNGSRDSFNCKINWGVPYFNFNGKRIYSSGRFGDNQWHHYAFTLARDPGKKLWTYSIYYDGKLRKSATAPETFTPGSDFVFSDLTEKGADGSQFDELRIYNRALKASEIATLAERIEATKPKIIQASGGHHDAGDYNPRSHIDVAQILLDAYEVAPKKFYDGQLNIPESGNGIPDIVDEALWALKLWIGLQDDDGGVYNGTESDGDPNFVQTVELDPKGDFAYMKDAQGSFLFAGAMAQASRLLKSVGKDEMAEDYLARARRAYDWAIPNKPKTNDAQKFAAFYTAPLAYAAAQLYHSTWEDRYHKDFLDNTPWQKNAAAKMTADNASYDLSLAAYAYAAVPASKSDSRVHSDVIRAICDEADSYLKGTQTDAYPFIRHPNAPINWGTGAYEHFLVPVWHAWAFTDNRLKAKAYREAMIHTADNTLGMNPMNLSWIVGLGSKTARAPLHNSRFNPTGFSVPGIQVQGPDVKGREYRFSETLYPKLGNAAYLYAFVDAIFAIGMDEGTVNHQAETMAAFGLLLPDRKPEQ